MTNRILAFNLLAFGFLLALVNSCCKDDNTPSNPTNGHTTAGFNPNLRYGNMTDQDGNVYKTIKIGTQTWMAENLRTRVYRNGDSIPRVTGNAEWAALTTGAYCYLMNTTSVDSIATFGGLYNWYAVSDSRGLAPKGWHVPTDGEWSTLIAYLAGGDLAAGDTTAGVMLEEAGNLHWAANTSNNGSGFTALPGIWRWGSDGTFPKFGRIYGCWWTTTETNSANARFIYLDYSDPIVYRGSYHKGEGYSIRCVKD